MSHRIDHSHSSNAHAWTRPAPPAQPRVHSSPAGGIHRDTFQPYRPPVIGLHPLQTTKRLGDQIFDAAKSYDKTPIGNLLQDAKSWFYDQKGNTKIGQFMDYTVDGTSNCANFVGGVLKQTGAVDKEDRMLSVYDVDKALRSPKYQQRGWVTVDGPKPTGNTPLKLKDNNAFFANADPPFKKGDVVVLKTADGKFGHVVFFAGFNDQGEPTFLGANNVVQVSKSGAVSTFGDVPMDPVKYPGAKTGDQAVCTLTLGQLRTMIGSDFGVTEVFRAPNA